MTREELIEAIARAMAECEPRSLYGDAVAALSAIEAAGVRLVPHEPQVGMFRALTESWGDSPEARRGIGQWALGQFREDYLAMLAASPYAPPGG